MYFQAYNVEHFIHNMLDPIFSNGVSTIQFLVLNQMK